MNPSKVDKRIIYKKGYHRIIIPVYIPELGGYYQYSFELLKLCLTSLFQTIHNQVLITIVNNNSVDEVGSYLNDLFKQNLIDQLVINSQNKGKVDAVLDVFRGSQEEIITIADSDVLFKSGWIEAVEEIFDKIPKVGFVSPLPLPNACNYFTGWSWYFGLIKGALFREHHDDLESLKSFNRSILFERELTSIENMPYKIKFNGVKAVIGSGHFCGTYNKNIVNYIPSGSSGQIFTGAELLFLDKPVEDAGFLRLATNLGWVFHMDNKPDNWMQNVLKSNDLDKNHLPIANFLVSSKGYFSMLKQMRVIAKIVKSKKIRALFNI